MEKELAKVVCCHSQGWEKGSLIILLSRQFQHHFPISWCFIWGAIRPQMHLHYRHELLPTTNSASQEFHLKDASLSKERERGKPLVLSGLDLFTSYRWWRWSNFQDNPFKPLIHRYPYLSKQLCLGSASFDPKIQNTAMLLQIYSAQSNSTAPPTTQHTQTKKVLRQSDLVDLLKSKLQRPIWWEVQDPKQ